MKKLVLAALAVLTMALVGCGATGNTDSKADAAADNQSVSEEVVSDDFLPSDNTDVSGEGDIENTTEEEAVHTTLTYIGHASVKIVAKDGTELLIDPNYEEWDWKAENPDIVIVTHGHGDHTPNYNLTMSDECTFINYKDAHTGDSYESYDVGPYHIEAVPAGNENHDIKYCVGYIVTVDGVSVYHAGDTSKLDSMSELADKNIDYAMYPIDGVYNMDAVEATEVAGMVGAKNNIPIHELNEDGQPAKEDNFTPDGKLVLSYGETIVIAE